MNTFGENLDSLMKKKRMTISELARTVGVRPQTASEWRGKSGRMPRNPEHLKAISSALQVSVHFLLYGEEEAGSSLADILEKSELHTGLYEISIKRVSKKKAGES